MVEPLRIRFREECHAVSFADELAGLAPIEVSRNSHAWEISIDDLQTKGLSPQHARRGPSYPERSAFGHC